MSHQSEHLVEEIHELTTAKDWKGLVEHLAPYVALEPGNHWFQSMMGMAHYYLQNFEKAFDHLTIALELNHNCPLGLWFMGNLLRDRGERQRAVGLWEAVARLDPHNEKTVTCPCCAWLTFGRTLVADSNLMLAVTYDELDYKELAKRYRNAYLKAMSEGVKSLVDKEKVREWLVSRQEG